jgi:hypothetical protein
MKYLDQIPHENIIQLVQLFTENLSYNINSLVIITTEVKESLDYYITSLKKERLVELVN